MRTKFFLLFVFFLLISTTYAQQNQTWKDWLWLMGEWKGEGSGQPGDGGGTFSFKNELDGKILVRKSHSEYPASGNRPATVHDDLMIVSLDLNGKPTKAIYFDNEGHTINYNIEYRAASIIMTSEKLSNSPIFRLTYSLLANQMVNTKFEMSQDGEKFVPYVEGKSKKI
jgi:hypothetical protein